MTHCPLDPRICNISVDANALDLDGSIRDGLVARFRQLAESGRLTVVVPGGVRDEARHLNTPANVQADILPRLFNLRPSLTISQQTERRRVAAILQGNAKPHRHKADASHVSEAAETGCGYFITHDRRILNKRAELAGALPRLLVW
jgi:hypothetical protein